MVVTKINFFVQRWGSVTIIVVERDIVLFMNKLNSDTGTI